MTKEMPLYKRRTGLCLCAAVSCKQMPEDLVLAVLRRERMFKVWKEDENWIINLFSLLLTQCTLDPAHQPRHLKRFLKISVSCVMCLVSWSSGYSADIFTGTQKGVKITSTSSFLSPFSSHFVFPAFCALDFLWSFMGVTRCKWAVLGFTLYGWWTYKRMWRKSAFSKLLQIWQTFLLRFDLSNIYTELY